MKKHIFRSICFVAISVFLASLVLIMGVLYDYFSRTQQTKLRVQTQLGRRRWSMRAWRISAICHWTRPV